MKIQVNTNSTENILFAAEIAKKYHSNEYYIANPQMFIKMCKLKNILETRDTIPLHYLDVKQWIDTMFKDIPEHKELNDRFMLVLNNITSLPSCKCKNAQYTTINIY